MNKKLVLQLAGVFGLACAVVGCGGGGSSADTAAVAPAAEQPSAIAQALAYIDEQKRLPSTDVDPQTLRQSLPAADDTIEPSPL